MSNLNKVMLMGRLGADPEVKFHPDGYAICTFSIATTDFQGEAGNKTNWHRINVFGKLADTCGKRLTKGEIVYVEGRLQTSSVTDSSGKKTYYTNINAGSVQFFPKTNSNSTSSDNPSNYSSDFEDIPF
jgi:single-strand DNA-binding protein